MKKVVLSALIAGLALVSCKKEEKTEVIADGNAQAETVMNSDSISAGDFTGIYEGTMPCADCEGIKTELHINSDDTYELNTEYLGKKDSQFSEKGKITWDESKTFATLNKDSEPSSPIYYFNEGNAYLVNKVGDNGTKPEYKLTKK